MPLGAGRVLCRVGALFLLRFYLISSRGPAQRQIERVGDRRGRRPGGLGGQCECRYPGEKGDLTLTRRGSSARRLRVLSSDSWHVGPFPAVVRLWRVLDAHSDSRLEPSDLLEASPLKRACGHGGAMLGWPTGLLEPGPRPLLRAPTFLPTSPFRPPRLPRPNSAGTPWLLPPDRGPQEEGGG